MIDLTTENLISIGQTPKHLPRRPNGKTVSTSAVYRWASNNGLRGVVLETLRIGGTTYTSTEALQRFADRLTAQRSQPPTPPRRTTPSRQAQARRAAVEIKEELCPAETADSSQRKSTHLTHRQAMQETPQPPQKTMVSRFLTGQRNTRKPP